MNIFKTLASGSGRLYEPNVSAFLGYLLNPKEDHGLGDAFLKKFLEPLLKSDRLEFMRGRDLSVRSNFEIEVLLEQAFEDNACNTKSDKNSQQIVDIVILCYEKKTQQGRFLAKDIIEQKKTGQDKPNHIFLIENKIKDESVEPKKEQLKKQFEQTTKRLDDWGIKDFKELVSVIFVTPEGANAKKEFDNFTKSDNNKTDNKYHLFWHKKDDISISKIIKDIISEESQPIDAYCKYTLQAFLEFIESDFKSTIEEDLEKKQENPRFRYNNDGIEYSRPKLAEKIIHDYIKNYKIENKKEITFKELGDTLFHGKMTKPLPPFVIAEEAKDRGSFRRDGTKIYDYYGYYNNPMKIADAEICSCTGYKDEELIELIKNAKIKKTLDEMRIKDVDKNNNQ